MAVEYAEAIAALQARKEELLKVPEGMTAYDLDEVTIRSHAITNPKLHLKTYGGFKSHREKGPAAGVTRIDATILNLDPDLDGDENKLIRDAVRAVAQGFFGGDLEYRRAVLEGWAYEGDKLVYKEEMVTTPFTGIVSAAIAAVREAHKGKEGMEEIGPDTLSLAKLARKIDGDLGTFIPDETKVKIWELIKDIKNKSLDIGIIDSEKVYRIGQILSYIAVLSDESLLTLTRQNGKAGRPGKNVASCLEFLIHSLADKTARHEISSLVFTDEERNNLDVIGHGWGVRYQIAEGADLSLKDWKPDMMFGDGPKELGPYIRKFFAWLEGELTKHGTSLKNEGFSAEFLARVGLPVAEKPEVVVKSEPAVKPGPARRSMNL